MTSINKGYVFFVNYFLSRDRSLDSLLLYSMCEVWSEFAVRLICILCPHTVPSLIYIEPKCEMTSIGEPCVFTQASVDTFRLRCTIFLNL